MRYIRLWVVVPAWLILPAIALAQGTPRIVLSQDTWDFGEVWHPQSAQLTLVVSNAGDADLRITNVRSSCGCTVAQVGKKLLKPGERMDVPVRFDTTGKQDAVTSKVTIESNDPQSPKVELSINGFVKRAVRRDPLGGLVIRTRDHRAGQTAKLRLENQLDEPMRLRVVSNPVPWLDLEIRNVNEGLIAEVVGKTNKDIEPGMYQAEIEVETGLSRESRFAFAFRAIILNPVELSPRALWINPTYTRDTTRLISLQSYREERLEFKGFECDVPGVKVEMGASLLASGGLERLDPPVRWIARGKVILPSMETLPNEFEIRFLTNDPERRVLPLLVTRNKAHFDRVTYGTTIGTITLPSD